MAGCPTVRIRIDLAYDGTDFSGWAKQPGLRTVQGDLEESLATVLRIPSVSVTCAGRTDTGVHARAQVVHLDVEGEVLTESAGRIRHRPVDALQRRLNGILGPDVRVRRVSVAPEGFDARFSALWRRYAYRIDDAGLVDPLTRNHVLPWPHPLDLDRMNAAAGLLLGEQDFAAFCKRREGATTIRSLLDLRWERVEGLAVATVRADAFCHNMVRSLVGCLVAVGEGRRDPSWAAEVLGARVRDGSVKVVPPRGLTLEEVAYTADDEVAARDRETRTVRTLEDV
jgi:tRNA pseudouridine38-40 synthase